MKKIFIGILAILIAATVYTTLTSSRSGDGGVTISWRSDANPQRYDQIILFQRYLKDHDMVTRDKEPAIRLNLDNADNQSTLIQAVSGTAGDVIDVYDVPGYQLMGVGVDITDDADRGGYGVKNTYPAMAGLITLDGRQYAYPCNGGLVSWWINLNILKQFGIKAPSEDWSVAEFEKFAREYIVRANKNCDSQEYYVSGSMDGYAGVLWLEILLRSKGIDLYNETLTAYIADTPVLAESLKLLKKWTYEEHFFPTAAEKSSMNTDAGYGGADLANFLTGKYAMVCTGRYGLIRMREFKQKLNLGIAMFPMYDYKNAILTSRSAMLFRGSRHPEAVKTFLQFLASREYNEYIVEYSDGLAPNPAVVRDKIAAIKTARPNEGVTHEREYAWAESIAIPAPWTKFVKSGDTDWLLYYINKYFNNRVGAEEAAQDIQMRYNRAIAETVAANPALAVQFNAAVELQKKIDEYKQQGRKLPAAWIKNPFYQKYYRDTGLLDESMTEVN